MTGIDVGAAEGLQPHWWSYEGAVDMYLFEPHPESARRLDGILSSSPYRSSFHILPFALARETGTRQFHVLNARTGSSLYDIDRDSEFAGPEDSYIYPIQTETVQVRSLAEVLDEVGLPRIDIAKLDVQGAELEILQGLDPVRMRNVLLVEAEVNLAGGVTRTLSPYVGAPSWSELDAYLLESGMRLLDVGISRSYRGRNGDTSWYQRQVFDVYGNSPSLSAAAWEADVVYVRDYRSLIEQGDSSGLRKLIVALGGYRFFSEAYSIVDKAEAASVFASSEAEELRRSLVEWHLLVARHWWDGRGLLLSAGRALARRLGISQLRRWKQYMWYDYPNG